MGFFSLLDSTFMWIFVHFPILLFFLSVLAAEHFEENLLLSSLPNGDILSLFNFTIFARSDHKVDAVDIPWLFQNMFRKLSINEFRLSLAQGFWRTNLWGLQGVGTEVSSGTELLVKFGAETQNAAQKWAHLVQTINGLFCTSILGIWPQFSGQPKVWDEAAGWTDNRWWYGALGGESVCTENLKSWKKLLPCKQNGLVALMEPTTLLSARFHAISVQISREQRDDGILQWKFSLLAKTVHDGERLAREHRELTLESIFVRRLATRCPVSQKSRIIVAENEHFKMIRADSLPKESKNENENNFAVIDLNNWEEQDAGLDIDLKHKLPPHQNVKSISMHSFVKSTNQIGGHICTQLTNPFPWPVAGQFTQMVPWQIRVFLHTLQFTCSHVPNHQNLPSNNSFALARDGGRPLLVQMEILLPENANCKIEMEYEAAFLKITDFPPDANSGIFIPGAVLTIQLEKEMNRELASHLASKSNVVPSSAKSSSLRLFAEPLLILLPVPDFSMPFNVICLVCTTIAIYYGNVFALSTKLMKLVPKEEKKQSADGNNIREKLKAFLGKCWDRLCQIKLVPSRWKSKRE